MSPATDSLLDIQVQDDPVVYDSARMAVQFPYLVNDEPRIGYIAEDALQENFENDAKGQDLVRVFLENRGAIQAAIVHLYVDEHHDPTQQLVLRSVDFAEGYRD